MAKHGKKYTAALAKVDIDKIYSAKDAVALAKETSITKFDSTIEVHMRTTLDSRQSDQQLRDVVVLPHGLGKTVRVLVFAQGEGAAAARAAGADFVADDDESLKKIEGGMLDFDVAIATPAAMNEVRKLGKVLGPRGLMPNPKTGTVTMEIGKAVQEVKAGKIDFKVDKYGIIHASIGKVSFDQEKIIENAKELISTIIKLKPSSAKGTYMKSVFMSSTMSPGIRIDQKSITA